MFCPLWPSSEVYCQYYGAASKVNANQREIMFISFEHIVDTFQLNVSTIQKYVISYLCGIDAWCSGDSEIYGVSL
jgi:hypothetical protein